MKGSRFGPYRILGNLGSGGMGRVFLAEVMEPVAGLGVGEQIALKTIHPHLVEADGMYERFMREAKLGLEIDHPNVVRTFDCDIVDHEGRSVHVLVMEYVPGQTLRDLAEELGEVPEELCRHAGREVAKGLAAIHDAGAVHRDLKPENVRMTPENEIKIMDLGVARLKDEAIRLSRTGHFVGSVLYAAPESFGGRDVEIDGRADLHGLGVLLYELATGQHPFEQDDMRLVLQRVLAEEPRRGGEINPQLSPFFEEVLSNLLQKKPSDRFSSANELQGVLEEAESSAWWRERAQTLRRRRRRPLRRIHVPRPTAIYGREGELEALQRAFEAVERGEGRVVLLEGEAGIGKTRLVDELVARLEREEGSFSFLFGSYPPGGAATAAGAFSTAYREHFGAEGAEGVLNEVLSERPLLVPHFASLLRGYLPLGQEALAKDSLQAVFVHVTRAMAAERPTVLLIDDLHFAPDEGRALFASLAFGVPGHRILLIGTMRPGIDEEWRANIERQPHVESLALGRLGAKDLAQLLEDAFHSENLATELGHKIALKSDGNPFFAFELIRGLKESRAIRRKEDGSWVATAQIRDVHMPSSVMELVNARVADLEKEDRDLLEIASCLGFEFDPVLVAEAAGLEKLPALRRFGQIEKHHRLVHSAGRVLRFDHHQVQESLYARMLEPLREECHAAIAEALEQRGPLTDGATAQVESEVALELCLHFVLGRRAGRALPYLDGALRQLDLDGSAEQALNLLGRLLESGDLLSGSRRVDVLLRCAGYLDVLGRRAEHEHTLEQALELSRLEGDPKASATVMHRKGVLCHRTGRHEEALQGFEAALEGARESGDRALEMQAYQGRGTARWSLGRLDEGLADHERALKLAEETGNAQGRLNALGGMGLIHLSQGGFAQARDKFRQALDIAVETGAKRSEALCLTNLGMVLGNLGRHEEAMLALERALELTRGTGDRLGEANIWGNLGTVFHLLRRMPDARDAMERHIEISREVRDRRGEAVGTGNLGSLLVDEGRMADALDHLERWEALASEIEDAHSVLQALLARGSAMFHLGRYAEARALFERGRAIAGSLGDGYHVALAEANLGSLDHEEGHHDEARDRLSAFLEASERVGDRATAGVMHLALGRLARDCRLPDDAARHLEEAARIAEDQGIVQLRTQVLAHQAVSDDGATSRAREAFDEHRDRLAAFERLDVAHALWKATGLASYLDEAHGVLLAIQEQTREEDRPALLEQVALHREVLAAKRD